MKARKLMLLIFAGILLIYATALGQASDTSVLQAEEWNWDNESVNAFSGTVNVNGHTGEELKLVLNAAFDPSDEAAAEIRPKFTYINEKRLTMLEQQDSMTFTPEEGMTSFTFSGSLRMPEKNHYKAITIILTVFDPDGTELEKTSMTVSLSGMSAARNGNILYIPFEIRNVALVIAAAALLIWAAAILRNRIVNRK